MTRYTLLFFLCLVTIVAYLQRSALAVPSKAIEGELGLTPGSLGLVWLAWYAGYAALQLPSAWVADRLGSKPTLLLFATTWSAVTAVVGLATGFTGLALLWGLMGAAQAGVFPCATKAIGATFPKTEQALASGLLACCMSGGVALSHAVTGRLIEALSWEAILVVYSVPGIAWAVVFALVGARPDAPRSAGAAHTPTDWGRLLTNPNLILLCAQQFQRAAATAFLFTWLPRFLEETKRLSAGEAGAYAAWPLLAGIPGGLLGGGLSDWLLKRTGRDRLSRAGLSVAAMVVASAASVAAYFADTVIGVVTLVSVAAFCAYISGPTAYAAALSMGGPRPTPVFATMNMAGNVGAGFFPFAVGLIVARTGDWNAAVLLFAALFAGTAVCWAVLDPAAKLYEDRQ
jgi:sugar phosphate permease